MPKKQQVTAQAETTPAPNTRVITLVIPDILSDKARRLLAKFNKIEAQLRQELGA